ncbi:hypothetical protein BGY98DRAFT_1030359 [Russula aff. rugulosa BPL654]|nr:hypothetical protein BGY98DRAFT_1030359 [Russula aff. rugulosa BPL654]
MFYEILLGRLTTVDREITARCIAIMITPAQLPRPPVPALPPQISQASSTRSIPPSSSSLPSPSPISSRPSWPGQRSRVSSTLHLHPHPAHQSQQRSNRPSTESTGHTDAHNSFPRHGIRVHKRQANA